MATTTTPGQLSQALLFIPDISGFTQFVNDTEINHARHIIEELLNLIIESNQLNLEVNEVEGDAILFSRMGPPPSAKELLDQVKQMFTAFHFHLQKYDTHRICKCSACKSANTLTLKFVIHYGEVAINQVQQHRKLFGIDVITVHRLLKNDIEKHEYALFTDSLIQTVPDWDVTVQHEWSLPLSSSQVYDSGRIDYAYMALDHLYEEVPELQPDDFRIKGHTASVLKTEKVIEAPLDMVFNVVSDLEWRVKWIPGTLPETTDMNSNLTQAGQTHRCLAKGPVMVAHDFSISKDVIYFTETDEAKSYCCVYTLTKIGDTTSRLNSELFLPKNFFKEVKFKLMMKKKFISIYEKSWENLNGYCKDLLARQVTHPYSVVL